MGIIIHLQSECIEKYQAKLCSKLGRGGGGGGDNSHRLGYGMCHFLRVLFWLENIFLGLFYSL